MFIGLFVAFPSLSEAKWVYICTNGGNSMYYVEDDRIKINEPPLVDFWMKTIEGSDTGDGGRFYCIDHMQANLDSQRYRVLSSRVFTDKGSLDLGADPTQWKDTLQGSPMDKVIKYIIDSYISVKT